MSVAFLCAGVRNVYCFFAARRLSLIEEKYKMWYNRRKISSLRCKYYFVILVGIAKDYSF